MKKILGFLKILGPGVITGASDDDPTAIATYAQSGAQCKYQQLWTTLFTLPFMIIIQEMAARIGIVTGVGIATIITQYYSKYIIYFSLLLLLIANIVNIGADVGVVAESLHLILPIFSKYIYLILTILLILGMQIFIGYSKFANILKFTSLILLTYVSVAFVTKQPWLLIIKSTIIPFISFKKNYLLNVVAIFGTNVSPYLFFWQENEEVEEKSKQKNTNAKKIFFMRIDTIIGMTFSNAILFFIEIASAATLGSNGITSVSTASQIAIALKPIAGNISFLLFSLGILASGFLAIPVLSTSCAYAVAETFNKKATLSENFGNEPFFYSLIILATCIGALVNFLQIKPITLLIYSAALNGILTPFLIVIILFIVNNEKIMNNHTNSLFSNVIGGLLAVIMTLTAGALIVTLF